MNQEFARVRVHVAALIACVTVLAGTMTAVVVATSGPALAAATPVRITGTVTDAEGYPLSGMAVQLRRADDDEEDIDLVHTDSRGRFYTPEVKVSSTARYRLTVDDPTGLHLSTSSATFKAKLDTPPIDLTLQDAGVVRGEVTTLDGDVINPATGVVIDVNGTFGFVSSNGKFRIGGLPTGTYSMTFVDQDEDGSRKGPLFRTICYDNVPVDEPDSYECSGETLVEVTAGEETTINPQVMDHKLGRLKGRVTDADGNAIKRLVNVTIYADNEDRDYLGSDLSTLGGKWHVNGIDYVGPVKVKVSASGDYRRTWYESSNDFAQATPIQLDQGEKVSGIRILMPQR